MGSVTTGRFGTPNSLVLVSSSRCRSASLSIGYTMAILQTDGCWRDASSRQWDACRPTCGRFVVAAPDAPPRSGSSRAPGGGRQPRLRRELHPAQVLLAAAGLRRLRHRRGRGVRLHRGGGAHLRLAGAPVRLRDARPAHCVQPSRGDRHPPNLTVSRATAPRNRSPRSSRRLPPTAETVLSIYGDPAVAASADGCEIDPATLLDQDKTLSLVAPARAQDRLRQLFEALVMSVVREAQNRAQGRDDLSTLGCCRCSTRPATWHPCRDRWPSHLPRAMTRRAARREAGHKPAAIGRSAFVLSDQGGGGTNRCGA